MKKNSPVAAFVGLAAADEAGMAALRAARETLDAFGVGWRETLLPVPVGASELDTQGLRAVIVASSDAALPSAVAEKTGLPVVRVPIPSGTRGGLDLLQDATTANLPAGDAPFATVAIGEAGAKNAALLVVSMLGLTDARLWGEWLAFRQRQTDAVLALGPLSES